MPSAATSTDANTGDLAHAHKRALQIARIGKPVQEERVKLHALARTRRARILVTVFVERSFAGRVKRQPARADFHQHMLRTQLVRRIKRGLRKLGHAVGHAIRFGDQALRAGNQVQAQRIFNGFRLHKRSVLDVACLRETLAGKHGCNRAGKHQHIAVKPQLNIRHGNILSTTSMIPKAACAMRRAAQAHINDARARAKRAKRPITGTSCLAMPQIQLLPGEMLAIFSTGKKTATKR